MTPRDGFDVTQEMVANPIADDQVICGQGKDAIRVFEDCQRCDPSTVFIITQHLPKVGLQVVPMVHRSKLT
jgi:hypothetical protein